MASYAAVRRFGCHCCHEAGRYDDAERALCAPRRCRKITQPHRPVSNPLEAGARPTPSRPLPIGRRQPSTPAAVGEIAVQGAPRRLSIAVICQRKTVLASSPSGRWSSKERCVGVTGHASRVGRGGLQRALSRQRAERRGADCATSRDARARSEAAGRGFQDTIVRYRRQ